MKPCHLHAAVKIEGGNDSLEGVRHDAGAGASAAALLAAAQTQVVAQMDLLRKLEQRPLADEAGTDAGQVALGTVGVGVEEVVCRNDLKHAVAQKFQTLIVLDRRAGLVGVAGVGERRFQQLRVLELVANDSL